MYQDAAAESSLKSTVAAVSHLNYMNRQQTGKLSSWVTSSYAKALAKTNYALSTPATAYTDSTLASVYMLSVFELLVSKKDPYKLPDTNAWSEHNNGATTLLLARGQDQLKTPRGIQLFRLVHTTSLIGMMMERKVPPKPLLDMITTALDTSPRSQKQELLISKELHLLVDMIAGGESLSSDVLEVKRAFEHEAIMDSAWQPRGSETLHESPHRWPQQYFFSSGFVMSNWLTHWASVILFHQMALDQFVDAGVSGVILHDRLALLAEVETSADQILGSVSFAFGEIDSLGTKKHSISHGDTSHVGSAVGSVHLLWPLGVILACPYVSDSRKLFAQDALRCIGHVFGVSRALHFV